jgi:MacB-like periplasmic core domain
LTGAGLANRSLYLLNTLDIHLGNNHLLLITLNTAGSATGKEQNLVLLDRLRERLGVVPGVVSASYARAVPPRSWSSETVRANGSREPAWTESNLVGPDYFRAVGVVPLSGRGFLKEDQTSAKRTVVINQDLAETLWPGQQAARTDPMEALRQE